MRTTLTIDDDVALRLEALQRQRRDSFKGVVNDTLRAGLDVLADRCAEARSMYRVTPKSLGAPRLPQLDNIAEVLELGEGFGTGVYTYQSNCDDVATPPVRDNDGGVS